MDSANQRICQNVASAHTYRSLQDAKAAINAVGQNIASDGTPEALGPMTFTFTGGGNVAQVMNHIKICSQMYVNEG